jgi:hypothetical protein
MCGLRKASSFADGMENEIVARILSRRMLGANLKRTKKPTDSAELIFCFTRQEPTSKMKRFATVLLFFNLDRKRYQDYASLQLVSMIE